MPPFVGPMWVVLLRVACAQEEIIWQSIMTQSDFSNWTQVATNGLTTAGYGSCNPPPCWSLQGQDYIYRIAATAGYHHISLQFSVTPYSGAECYLFYNADNVGDANWTPFLDAVQDKQQYAAQYYFNASADDNSGFGIKVEAQFTSGDRCLLRDFYLLGTPITASPTNVPTGTPTKTPSSTPTSAPSAAPTNAPSAAPTRSPSAPPTSAPSTAPSSTPSSAPSESPTLSPTTCYDGTGTNDGENEQSIGEQIASLHFENTVNNNSRIVVADGNGQYVALNLSDFHHDEKQQLECSGIASCLQSNIRYETNAICNLLCDASASCQEASATMNDCNEIQIICNGQGTCDSLQVEIHDASNVLNNVHIECGSASSCNAINIQVSAANPDANISISCYGLNACDNMLIESHPVNYHNATLSMYSYSANVQFSNGFGYEELDESKQFVHCNTQNQFIKYRQGDTNTSLTTAVLDEYENNLFPCDGVTVLCSDENATDDSSCDMKWNVYTSDFSIPSPDPSASCYWVPVAHLVRIDCDGTCASSPTYAPTSAPTASPTLPTSHPSAAPTTSPTSPPTAAPSKPPTSSPTVNPSTSPTSAPSASPSAAPSFNPTYSPSSAPSGSPTSAPSLSPTLNPTSAPSVSPSRAPSLSPTLAPSSAPSSAPSVAPSSSPSPAPSFSPTHAPTRYPTEDERKIYDTKILIQYSLEHLTTANKEFIANSTFTVKGDIQSIIESCYFTEDDLEYTMFWVDIYAMNEVSIVQNTSIDEELLYYKLDVDNRFDKAVILSAEIQSGANIAGFIISKSQGDAFREEAQQKLRDYSTFDNDVLEFSVSNAAALKQEPIEADTGDDDGSNTAIIVSVVIVSVGAATSFGAFVFNKLPLTKVDNAKFWMPILIALNIYDFLSDINLSVAIFEKTAERSVNFNNNLLFLAVASLFFVILPFGANLYYAMRITHQAAIKQNPSARAWFGKHLPQFILLCVVSGGTYPVLGLTSSRIFGLDFFNAGLLAADLMALSKIKLRSTIYMENAPQLLIQVVYAVMIRRLDADTILAFIASTLSIIASVIIFQAQKTQQQNCIDTNYFIEFSGKEKLSAADSERIKLRKGLKERLGFALCHALGIPAKSIEVGYVTIQDGGCSIHVQHSVFLADLSKLENIRSWDKTETAYDFVETAFVMHRSKIRNALAEHFKVSNSNAYTVTYQRVSNLHEAHNAVSKHGAFGQDKFTFNTIPRRMENMEHVGHALNAYAHIARPDGDREEHEERNAGAVELAEMRDHDAGKASMVISMQELDVLKRKMFASMMNEFDQLQQGLLVNQAANANMNANTMEVGEDLEDSTNLQAQ